MEQALWIRNSNVTPFVLTFSADNMPEYVEITGEYTLPKVYPYIYLRQHYNKCQKYIQSQTRCSAKESTCRLCANSHATSNCTAMYKNCANCDEDYAAGYSTCKEQQRERQEARDGPDNY